MGSEIDKQHVTAMIAAIVAASDPDSKRREAGRLVAELHAAGMLRAWVQGARARTDLSRELDDDLQQDAAERLLLKLSSSTSVPAPDKVFGVLYHLVLGAVKDVARSPARRDGRTGLSTTARRGALWRAEWQRLLLEFGREPSDQEVAERLNQEGQEEFDGSNHLVPQLLPLDEQRDEPEAESLPTEVIARDLAVLVAQRVDAADSAEYTRSATQWALGVGSGLIDPSSAAELAALRGISYYHARRHLTVIQTAIADWRVAASGVS